MSDQEKSLVVLTQESIQNRIYLIRGQRVMLDADLAEIYGYETKRFNEQVKNNIEKFDEDFRFQLTKNELENLRSKFSTSSWGGSRYLPYAFTEQGIYMLMTVLRGDLATRQSKALIRLFKQMKDYIVENQDVLGSKALLQLATQTNQNTKDIAEIKDTMATKEDLKKVMDNFVDPDTYKHFLILDGKKVEADLAYGKIYKSAKKSIDVVDNYISLKTLELFLSAKDTVEITLFSDNLHNHSRLTASMLKDFLQEYPKIHLQLKTTGGKYHDRYIAIDYGTEQEVIYHCGASSKDAGSKITSILKIDDTSLYRSVFNELRKQPELLV